MDEDEFLYRLMSPEDEFYMGIDEEEGDCRLEPTRERGEIVSFCAGDCEDANRKLDYMIASLEKELNELKKKTSPNTKR